MNARILVCILCALVPLSCGGGGGGGGTPPPPLNTAPSLQAPTALSGSGASFSITLPTASTQSLQFAATDADGDTLQWVATDDGAGAAAGIGYSSPAAGATFTITLSAVPSPVASLVTVLVEDPHGGAAAVDVLVVRSGAPGITAVQPTSAFAGNPQQVEITGTALRLGGAVNTVARFDGDAATGVVVDSDVRLRCTTPSSVTPGATIVSVANVHGSASLPGSAFTMLQFPPNFTAADQRLDATGADGHDVALAANTAQAVWLETGVLHHARSVDGGATWSPAQTLSGAEAVTAPVVLAVGDTVLVGWIGDGLAIRLRRSVDGGATFAAEQRIDIAGAPVTLSRLRACFTGQRAFACWLAGDVGLGTARVVAVGSANQGASWGTALPVEDVGSLQTEPLIATNGVNGYLVCLDERAGAAARGVYATRTTNGGATWSAMRRLSQQGVASNEPCLAAEGNRVHVGWVQSGSLYYGGSTDGGLGWTSTPTEVRNTADATGDGISGAITGPRIAASATNVALCYVQAGNTVFVSRLAGPGGGVSRVRLDAETTADAQTRVEVTGAYVFAAWRRGAVGDGSARVLQSVSTDSGATFTTAATVTTATAAQDQPDLAVDGARMLIGWLDSRDTTIGLRVDRDL